MKRFWAKVARRGPEECWLWTGSKNQDGYGNISMGSRSDGSARSDKAHRVCWQLVHGPIPRGLHVLHHCDNPACVNPAHLWLGTAADNNRDRERKGRSWRQPSEWPRVRVRGERHHRANVCAEEVREIRKRAQAGEKQASLALEFGISTSTTNSIVLRKIWRHVP